MPAEPISPPHRPEQYGDTWAEVYDEIFPTLDPAVVPFMLSRAGSGPMLELAIGTGRVALPLAESGLEVHGIDSSPRMLERLRSKPGGEAVPIVGADMTGFTLDRRYRLILLGFNTLFTPLEAELQGGVFVSVARALTPDGCFVIDCFVPDLERYERGQNIEVRRITDSWLMVDHARLDEDNQRITSVIELKRFDGTSALLPVELRYLWPHQIDSLATEAGLVLAERYEWYDETPFTDVSSRHVSVYTPA